MAVDVLKILPKIGDVAVPSAGRQSQLSERILLEMIQRESSMQQQENKSALDSYKDAVASMNSEEFFGTTPYTQRIYERQQGKLAEFANALKEASTDSRKVNSIMLDYNIWKKTDPGMRQAVTEETALKDFHERTKNSTDKIDPVAFENMYSKINDPNRDAPLTFADLNPASITYDISKVGDDYIKAMTTSKDEFVKDEDANRISKQTTYTIPDDAEERLVKHYKENPAFKDYPEAKIRTLAKEKVDNFKLVNQNPKIDGNGENYSDDKRDELQKASSTEKLTYPEKVAQDLNEDGIKATFSNGAKGTTRVINGVPHVLDESGKDLGTAEDNWNDLSDQSKEDLRISGVGAGYDKYVVNGSGVALGEKGFERTAIESSGMALTDKLYLDGQGISKTKANFTDGYLETNNPAVLRQAGFELEYDEANKKYKVRDIKTGTIYDEGKDSIFKTSGGGVAKGTLWHKVEAVGDIDVDKSTEKMFSIKVDPIVKAAAPAPSSVDANDKAYRNNNPFSLNSGDKQYATLDEGYKAGVADTEDKIAGTSKAMKESPYMTKKYGKDGAARYVEVATVEDMINVRTPKSVKGNKTDATVKRLEANGVPANTKLSSLNDKQKDILNREIVKSESRAAYDKLFGADSMPVKTYSGKAINMKQGVEKEVQYLSNEAKDFVKTLPFEHTITSIAHHRRGKALTDNFDVRFNDVYNGLATDKGMNEFVDKLKESGYEAHEEYNNRADFEKELKEQGVKIEKGKNVYYFAEGHYMITYNPKASANHYHFQKYTTDDFIESDDNGEIQEVGVDSTQSTAVTPPSTPPDTTNIYKAPPIDKKKTLQYK